jgi:hypothetical protein
VIRPIEIFTHKITCILFDDNLPGRIFTDRRAWPGNEKPQLLFDRQWIRFHRGRYDALETRPAASRARTPSRQAASRCIRTIRPSCGAHLSRQGQPRLATTSPAFDHALTEPWTVNKRYLQVPQEKLIY